MNEELLKRVGDKIFPRLGFSPTELLWQRLARVVQQEARRAGAASVEEFLQRALRGEQAVLEAICRGLTINETYFVREPKHFDALGQLLVGAPEVLEQLAVGGRLLERVQLRAVEVLQQRVAQHVVVVGLADDGGDRVATRLP